MLFPKTKAKTKKKRMRHPASILHDKSSRTCYLCVTLHDNWNEHRILDEHHIFGGPNRKNSEEYGLKVYLCHDHHIYGPEAVHNNARIRHELQRTAQKLFEKQHSHKEFMEIFGRNYLDPVEIGETVRKRMNLYKVVDQNGKQVFEDLLIARQVTEKTGCTKNNVAQAAANFALVNKKYRIIPEDIKLSKVLDVELLAEWDRYRKWMLRAAGRGV